MAAAAPRRVIGGDVHRCLRGFVAGGRYNRLPSVKLSRCRFTPRPDEAGLRSHELYWRVRKARAERLVMDVPSARVIIKRAIRGPRGEARRRHRMDGVFKGAGPRVWDGAAALMKVPLRCLLPA